MPTVLRVKGYRIHFYSSDGHEPAHVHVSKDRKSSKVWLEPNLKVQYFSGYKSSEQREIWEIVESNYDDLINQWNEFFSE